MIISLTQTFLYSVTKYDSWHINDLLVWFMLWLKHTLPHLFSRLWFLCSKLKTRQKECGNKLFDYLTRYYVCTHSVVSWNGSECMSTCHTDRVFPVCVVSWWLWSCIVWVSRYTETRGSRRRSESRWWSSCGVLRSWSSIAIRDRDQKLQVLPSSHIFHLKWVFTHGLHLPLTFLPTSLHFTSHTCHSSFCLDSHTRSYAVLKYARRPAEVLTPNLFYPLICLQTNRTKNWVLHEQWYWDCVCVVEMLSDFRCVYLTSCTSLPAFTEITTKSTVTSPD